VAATPLASLTSFVGDYGLYAVFALMVIDAVFPAASELVMLYAGAVAAGTFADQHVSFFGSRLHSHFWAFVTMSLAGVLGNTAGSLVGWAIGAFGGRPYIERHPRLFHADEASLRRADRWFDRFGDAAVLLGRLTPVIRSFVSIPAGFVRMPLVRFTVLTFLGCVPWCFGIAGAGWALGANYHRFDHDFRYAEIAVVLLALAALGWLGLRRRSSRLARRGPVPPR
jgi:membrane protein DedA with SNARE-associated domain